MSFAESEEQTALRHAVRSIAGKFGHEYYVECNERGLGAPELMRDLGKAGFVGVSLPEEYGGGGAGLYELCIVAEEVAAAGCPLMMLVVSPAVGGQMVAEFGSDQQRKEVLPRLAAGDLTLAFAITEPTAGSNSHNLATTATENEDGSWSISGEKVFISGLDESEQMLVVTQTRRYGDAEHERGRLSMFLVPTDHPGIERSPIDIEIVSTERQYLVNFDQVTVPGTSLVGEAGEGLKQVLGGLNAERSVVAAMLTGIARYALAKGSDYAKTRTVWGSTPLGAYQSLAHPLARGYIATESARLMTQKAAWLADQGEAREAGLLANMAKLLASEAAGQALDSAIQVHGGAGMSREYGLATFLGMVRMNRIAPIGNELILNRIARAALGLPKSY